MSTLLIDGFDKYGPATETAPAVPTLITQGEWNSVGAGSIAITSALTASGGYALKHFGSANQFVTKTLAGTYSRLIGGVRIKPGGIGTDPTYLFAFLDVGTVQCSVRVNIDGTISLVNGVFSGTAVATSASSITQNSVHYLEWDITFGASASYHLYLDGISILSGSTGNTKTTANSYATVFLLGTNVGFGSGACTFDDLYIFDTSGSYNNAVLNTNPIVVTQFPTSDAQTQFANNGNFLGTNYSATTDTTAPGANVLVLRKYVAPVACTLQSISIVPMATGSGAKFKPVAYADSGGAPASRLSTGSEVVGATSGTTITLPLTTPQSLSAAATYWIGYITDTSLVMQQTESTGTSTLGYTASNTYGSGAPTPAPAMTGNQASFNLWGNCTGASTNYESVNQNPAPGDTSAIDSATVSNEDLYGFAALPVAITSVYVVGVKAHVRKSDTGARTIDLRTKSVSTDSGGSSTGQAPTTTYGWMDSYFETDPATSTTWTTSGVNAATSGIKIAS